MYKKLFLLLLLITQPLWNLSIVYATDGLDIVINEIAWAGSVSSGSDEFIELYNNTSSDIDMTGFSLEDDSAILYEFQGEVILANSYFLIEKREEATSIPADLIVSSMSLANAGDFLELKDELGESIDLVNSTGGSWFAGSSSSRATMARVDSFSNGNSASNWGDSILGNDSTDSEGEDILGTPKSINNVTSSGSGEASISFLLQEGVASPNDNIHIDIVLSAETDIFSYGFSVEFDENILNFVGASKGTILDEEGDIETSFQSGFLQSSSDTLIISESRLQDQKENISFTGDDILATLEFEVIGEQGDSANLIFLSDSFISSLQGDIDSSFSDLNFSINMAELNPVENLQATIGVERYTFSLSWDTVQSADSYVIQRYNYGGYEEIAEITTNSFTDDEFIVPMQVFEYKVFAKAGDLLSTESLISIQENRGVEGDFNRTDRVDGRDLEDISKSWQNSYSDTEFNPLIDSNRDGSIDILDLYKLSSNWGKIY